MHTAEHNGFGIHLRSEARELQGIAGKISVAIDFLTLVMMTEDHGATLEFCLGRADARVADLVFQRRVKIKCQSRYGHYHSPRKSTN